MNNSKKLRRNLLVLFLTLLMLGVVTVAWFINWTIPFTEAFRFPGAALNVNVTITEEDGSPLPSVDGNAVMVAENMEPGDYRSYRVTIENNGAACRVFLGLSDIKNYGWNKETATYAAIDASAPERPCLSDVLRASLEQETAESSGAFVEKTYRFIGRETQFNFEDPLLLTAGERMELRYVVRFEGKPAEDSAQGSGSVANNQYTLKRTTGLFSVTSTLAH